eukprot:TRINITY_DN1024_c0_g1_i2.p1 TRINITY_DN1024_c0_g1~~TRINITY_DN1024_c0_g1_i2.p1  ORF type:complete len:300 (-),score=43.12 TRINITY_DN1024_c0_g1_i2:844-1659(-)
MGAGSYAPPQATHMLIRGPHAMLEGMGGASAGVGQVSGQELFMSPGAVPFGGAFGPEYAIREPMTYAGEGGGAGGMRSAGGRGRGPGRGPGGLGKGPRIFVGGVPDELTEKDMRTHFEKYGAVEDVYFPKDKNSTKRRGFCYVRFNTAQSADAAAARSPRTIAGLEIGEIKVAQPRPDDENSQASMGGGGGGYPSPIQPASYGGSHGGGAYSSGGLPSASYGFSSAPPLYLNGGGMPGMGGYGQGMSAAGGGDNVMARGRDVRQAGRFRPY